MNKKTSKNNTDPQPFNGVENPPQLNDNEFTQPLNGQVTDIPKPTRLSNEKLI